MSEYFLIAEITSAGKNGYLKFQGNVGFSNLIENNKNVYIDFWDQKKAFEIEDILGGKNSLYVKFKRFDDRRDISLLLGRNIYVKSEKMRKLSDETALSFEIVGYSVYQSGIELGIVNDIFQMPANDVIVFSDTSGKEILIPYVLSIFEKIDKEKKVLILNSDYGIQDDED